MQFLRLNIIFFAIFALISCRNDIVVFMPENEQKGDSIAHGNLQGFYLLNEGNMGSNKTTLDFYDFDSLRYTRNIYAAANPDVPMELGDVGNDLKIYGSKLYAVLSCSNKVEVMDSRTTQRIGQIDVPNCRYICFHEGYAYLTSYAGPVQINPDYVQRGFVAKIDTATLQVVDTCLVGFQPDDMEIVNGKLYVANSGGYMNPNYENTLSVIDLTTFREEKRIPVAINMHRIQADKHNQLWISCRGDYYDTPSSLYCVNTQTQEVCDSLPISAINMHLDGDSLYVLGSSWSYQTMGNSKPMYAIIDVRSHNILTTNFITDGTETKIARPYGISINPKSKEIYLTDARYYVSSGWLHCYSPQGILKWSVRTGDIPAHIAFLYK